MLIFPAIDLYEGKAVRLYKGNYSQMTIYSNDPNEVAADFVRSGANQIHLVDLEGARTGETPNFETVLKIKETSGAFCEIGGGIRSLETIEKYVSAGIDRVILGTAALQGDFVEKAVAQYGGKIAVGVDIRDGFVAVKGWTEKSDVDAFDFCEKMCRIGVKTIICTDISKDGAMNGTNHELYRELSKRFPLDITASGGISSLDDVKKLRKLNIYGAIIGKAYYTCAINLTEAVEAAK